MIVRLKKYSKNTIPETLKNELSQYKYVFNPSYIVNNQNHYLAIRLFDETSNSILAMLYIWTNEYEFSRINLSEYFKTKTNLKKVADPKLFVMGNSIWGTFNNGFIEKENNIIGLFKIKESTIKQHYFCEYKNRSRIEKNWSFYSENNQIFALYGLNPLTILKLSHFENEKAIFKDYFIDRNQNFYGYTIGTPLAKIDSNHLFIAHKKIVKSGKRLYLGKAFLLNTEDEAKLKSSGKYLIHSLKSLLGVKKKFNKNLISCTYFSGIFAVDNNICLSYGINDVNWNVITTKLKKIWG